MVNKINVYENNQKIGEVEFYNNEFGEFVAYEGKNITVEDDWEQTDNQGIIQSLGVFIEKKLINQKILNEILAIEWEFGYQAGRWEQNEHIFEEIAETEFQYITDKCKNLKFKYTIDKEMLQDKAQEYQETMITDTDIKEVKVTYDNYWQFDALADDIKEQLINFLKQQL